MDSVFQSATTQAEEINRLHIYFFYGAGFILFVVIAATIFILYKFKSKGEGNDYTPKTLSGKWEILMLGVPTAMIILFFFLTIRTMGKVLPSADGRVPDVVITGHQFWWEAQYPSQNVTAANEIHLPAGRTILLKLLSTDVIHDWWIPEFGNKMDLVSGRENFLWLHIKKPGRYYGACSEFCGAQHAGMRIVVVAQPEAEYNQWLQQHKQAASVNNDALAQTGAQLFQIKTCGNCHSIHGTAANGKVGPDLTHLASRQTLLSGIIPNNKENLSHWIQNPQDVKPGANMPKFLLDKQNTEALVAYLSSLK
ncbi:MAG: cytochrome c oxidase subunit II [Segetibacter sp.]